MDQDTRWNVNYQALLKYIRREGHALVPTGHVEFFGRNGSDASLISLGNWVNYMRVRYRNGQLSSDRAVKLQALPGWEWGPLKPGPRVDAKISIRNQHILNLRQEGYSLSAIADLFDLTRQRVHQIVNHEEIRQ